MVSPTDVVSFTVGSMIVSATALEVIDPVEAVIEAVPAAIAVTTPAAEKPSLRADRFDIQVKFVSESVSPDGSSATARNGSVDAFINRVVPAITETLVGAVPDIVRRWRFDEVSATDVTRGDDAQREQRGERHAIRVSEPATDGETIFDFHVYFSHVECTLHRGGVTQ